MKSIACQLCGYKWLSRIKSPKTCPRCKRYDYSKTKKITKYLIGN